MDWTEERIDFRVWKRVPGNPPAREDLATPRAGGEARAHHGQFTRGVARRRGTEAAPFGDVGQEEDARSAISNGRGTPAADPAATLRVGARRITR
jgi:hypothetical protein